MIGDTAGVTQMADSFASGAGDTSRASAVARTSSTSVRSLFRLRSDRPDAWDVESDSQHIDYRVFAGPQPLDVVRRMSSAIGRQPAPAAPWVLGPWWQPTGPNAASLPTQFRSDDVPGSLIQTYTHYLPCGDQVGHTDAERGMVFTRRSWTLRISGAAPVRLDLEAALPECVSSLIWNGRKVPPEQFSDVAGCSELPCAASAR